MHLGEKIGGRVITVTKTNEKRRNSMSSGAIAYRVSISGLELRNAQLLPRLDEVHVVADDVAVGFVDDTEVGLRAIVAL